MLKIITSMKELNFSALMEVYIEGNQKDGKDNWPDSPSGLQLQLAEQAAHQYLRECFFTTPGAVYYVWTEGERYISALRLEPYRDGFLLEALETAPAMRQQGYAVRLIRAVLAERSGEKIYSHIHKRNTASIAAHESCGFHRVRDMAVYADGSVLSSNATYLYEKGF